MRSRGEPTHLGYEPYFDPSCTVYMMSGVPGSGKSTWIHAMYNARVEITYLEAPLAETLERNAGRERQVPESVIRRLMERAEPPTVAEAHVVRVIDSAALVDSL